MALNPAGSEFPTMPIEEIRSRLQAINKSIVDSFPVPVDETDYRHKVTVKLEGTKLKLIR